VPLLRRSFTALTFGLVGLVALAACGDSAGTATAPPTSVTASTMTPSPTSAAPGSTLGTSAAPTTTLAGQVIELTYANGKVTGGGRKRVEQGKSVTLRVTSDVADEVHLHGYDKSIQLAKSTTGELTFVADIPGVFEVELEKKHVQLVELEVR
jgi:hypothetical protein